MPDQQLAQGTPLCLCQQAGNVVSASGVMLTGVESIGAYLAELGQQCPVVPTANGDVYVPRSLLDLWTTWMTMEVRVQPGGV